MPRYRLWSRATGAAFQERAKCFVKQYSEAVPGLDGNQTLSENLADNGGLAAGYRAYLKWRMAGKRDR